MTFRKLALFGISKFKYEKKNEWILVATVKLHKWPIKIYLIPSYN